MKNKKITGIEKEFTEVLAMVSDDIKNKLDAACKLLSEAEALAIQNGIPFSSEVSRISQTFWPDTVFARFEGISQEFVEEMTETSFNDNFGWSHSAIC